MVAPPPLLSLISLMCRPLLPRGTLLPAACALGVLAGCADSIRPADFGLSDAAAPSDTGELVPTGPVTTARNPDGSYTTLVDATSMSAWTHLDLDAGAEVAAEGPWELRFQRFHISTNGGVTGAAGVEVAAIAGRAFDEVTAAPATGWISDAPDGDDAGLDPDYAFGQGDRWYDYDFMTHVLTPRPLVWIVRAPGGPTVKLAIERYYDTAGTPGWIKLRWRPI